MKRIPKNYQGTLPTGRTISSLLKGVMQEVTNGYEKKGDAILASWPEIVGPRIASMTRAVAFEEGTLRVVVRHSTLLSLLVEHEKSRLLTMLQKRFPAIKIHNILFFLG